MVAVDNGTTVALVIAVFTLIGTISANVVAWHKARIDAKNYQQQMSQEHQKSNVEVAQAVMAQTVTTLNDRLKVEFELNEKKINSLEEEHALQILKLNEGHKRDVIRLESKIDRLSAQVEKLKQENERLRRERA